MGLIIRSIQQADAETCGEIGFQAHKAISSYSAATATITTAKEGLKKLETLIHMLDPDYGYAIEVRHRSWFDTNFYKLLSDKEICPTWSQLDTIQTHLN